MESVEKLNRAIELRDICKYKAPFIVTVLQKCIFHRLVVWKPQNPVEPETFRISPQLLAFYRNLLCLRLLFKNQIKLKLSFAFKWIDISELKMPKLVDLCVWARLLRRRCVYLGGSKKDISIPDIWNLFYKSSRPGGIRAAKQRADFSGPGRDTTEWILTRHLFFMWNSTKPNVNMVCSHCLFESVMKHQVGTMSVNRFLLLHWPFGIDMLTLYMLLVSQTWVITV